jgi:hypothetical protein
MKSPSDYRHVNPMNSVMQKSEAETVMRNIIIILARTGNTWHELSFDEYQKEREKCGNFSRAEKPYFDQVIDYAHPDRIGLFASAYRKIWKDERVEKGVTNLENNNFQPV